MALSLLLGLRLSFKFEGKMPCDCFIITVNQIVKANLYLMWGLYLRKQISTVVIALCCTSQNKKWRLGDSNL